MKILVTGFRPFPGSPYNPTAQIAKHLARQRRPHYFSLDIPRPMPPAPIIFQSRFRKVSG